ncbi:MAG: prepilin-type N-terminal cleavage/methylation domain-containing protein [Vulcanimicrobiota bacterium]
MKKFIRAFTVVELIVTISIIAIILVIAIPQFSLYNNNLRLERETKRFESFLKETRMQAKNQFVDIDLYDCTNSSSKMNVMAKAPSIDLHRWLVDEWVSPACAAISSSSKSCKLKAQSIKSNYLSYFTFSDGVVVSSSYDIHYNMTVTPKGFRDKDGNAPMTLTFTVWSAATPKAFDIMFNYAGVSSTVVHQEEATGGGGD